MAVERAAVLMDDLREGEAREEVVGGERDVCDDVSMVLDVRRCEGVDVCEVSAGRLDSSDDVVLSLLDSESCMYKR